MFIVICAQWSTYLFSCTSCRSNVRTFFKLLSIWHGTMCVTDWQIVQDPFHLGHSPPFPHIVPPPPDSLCTQPQAPQPSTFLRTHTHSLQHPSGGCHDITPRPTTRSPLLLQGTQCLCGSSLSPSRKAIKIDCFQVMRLMYAVGVCLFV